MDGFSAASAAAGVVSLGITVCQGLWNYYSAFKDSNSTMMGMLESIEALLKTLKVIENSIRNAKLGAAALKQVNDCIASCRIGIDALDSKLKKIQEHTKQVTWRDKPKAIGERILYPFKESTLVKLKERSNELRDNLSVALTVLQIDASVIAQEKLEGLKDEVSGLSKSMAKLLHQSDFATKTFEVSILKAESDKTFTDMIDWLSPPMGQFERKQQEIFNTSERQDGMACWLIGTTEFKTWLNSVGIGKTVLASFLIDSLTTATKGKEVGIAHIYCSYQDRLNQSPSNLITSLLQQLVMQKEGTSEDLITLYKRHIRFRSRPLFEEFLRLLNDMVGKFSKVYIIVDGLDECPEADSTRFTFLEGLRRIQPLVSILVTSRYIPNIETNLYNATRIELETNEEDIRNYLSQRIQNWNLIQRHIQKEPTLHEQIISTILQKAQKVFLLARLYIESLSRLLTLRKVKAALRFLPEGFDEVYREAMERIQTQDPECAALAFNVLALIYYAKRPLRLLELQHSLAVEPGDRYLDEDGLLEVNMIISVCGGLISMDIGENLIFVHFSIQEYFDKKASGIFQNAEDTILQSCLTYLLFEEMQQGPSENDEAFELRLQQYPFLEYAAIYWGFHMPPNPDRDPSIEKLALTFLESSKAVATSVQVRTICPNQQRSWFPGYSSGFPAATPSLILVASFGLTHMAYTLLQTGYDIELEDSRGVRALHEAIWKERDTMVHLLLDKGAKASVPINSRQPPLHSSTAMQGYPLHLLAAKGNTSIVKRLVESGEEPNVQIENGWTPLHMAAANGYTAIVELLLLHGADVNKVDSHGATALYRTAENGHTAVISLLFDHKADPNLRSRLDQTPLLRAAENGHDVAVALLLANGADWTIKDHLGWTPLYRALDGGHQKAAMELKTWIRKHRVSK